LHGPPAKGDGLKQHDVDSMMMATDAKAQVAVSATAASIGESDETLSAAPSGGSAFEPAEPLSFAELDPVKRATLFG
ncbi:MAG: hypothetical protein ACRECI_08940, partial [Methyloceanibacter sp.]